MKKRDKIFLIVISIIIIVFDIAGLVYAVVGKGIAECFTSEDEEKLSGIWDELKRDGRQSVTIDDYLITLESYLYEDATNNGYVCFSVKREDFDMREEIAGNNVLYGVYSRFGEDERFTFDTNAGLTCKTYYKKGKDIMYVYYKFDVINHQDFDNKILLCDSKIHGEEWIQSKNAVYEFKLENNINNLSELESKYE